MVELNYIFQSLEIITSLGQKKLNKLKFLTDKELISKELDKIEETISYITKFPDKVENIKLNLMYIKDITIILERLKSGYLLDDIELFELKHFAYYYEKIRKNVDLSYLNNYSLEEVFQILDPDNEKLPTFYIYDSYSEELSEIRKKKKNLSTEEKEVLFQKELEIEDKIREELTNKLFNYVENIEKSINDISELDFVLAKSYFALQKNFVKPEFSEYIEYYSLFNPVIKDRLNEENKEYQPIDIKLFNGVTLLTGANMTGKTVILKTIALSQYLFQYGFYVPAKIARIKPVNKIFLISGDYQSTLSGLSSYAAEMVKLNEILEYIKEKNNSLILLDELARNTNPHEGKLIVKGVIEILKEHNSISLITTHFNNVADESIRKLRIKGIRKDKLKDSLIPENINDIIDYSLIEEKDEIVPEEALTIAKLLNIDSNLIQIIDRLKKEENSNE
ncbi:DNA mismatch repair protein MutS [Marinitoga sp. 38H-ov]|uniref:lysine 5,6-aminomutase reactivase ATPase KamC n=1 Tax=Marinitoga sp. 38H-ov TaxID=1755814 RepID=UPI0013ED772A|nr:DNA mismatch repair protein MutS [Marinitoga sp. 38H-ov]KAF2955473.1 DNA mismatch repair protein MutS [Marinitoga sp. 38H-ov]